MCNQVFAVTKIRRDYMYVSNACLIASQLLILNNKDIGRVGRLASPTDSACGLCWTSHLHIDNSETNGCASANGDQNKVKKMQKTPTRTPIKNLRKRTPIPDNWQMERTDHARKTDPESRRTCQQPKRRWAKKARRPTPLWKIIKNKMRPFLLRTTPPNRQQQQWTQTNQKTTHPQTTAPWARPPEREQDNESDDCNKYKTDAKVTHPTPTRNELEDDLLQVADSEDEDNSVG